MLERWRIIAERGQAIDMRLEMMALTLAVLAKAIFGTDWTREADAIGSGVTDMLEYTFEGMVSPLDIPENVPIPSNRRFLKARNSIDSVIYRVIADRRRTGPDGTLLSQYVEVKDEETGETMTDRQVRDEIMALLIAGHETVSTGMVWTWYLLSKHPHAWQRVQEELAEVLGGRTPTPDDVPQLKYITMVLEESMRLYPPLWVMGRMPLTDDEIDGYHIPARSIILLSQYVTHRHPDFWENPEGFDPERFSPERSAGRHRYQYFPFGGGPRKCIGQGFAMVEMPLIVALVAQRYRLDVVPGHPIDVLPGISLRARHGMLMTIHDNPGPRPGVRSRNGSAPHKSA
jgi:cytochrome P450